MGCFGLLLLLFPCSLLAAPDYFARFSSDREGIYAGESFLLTLTLYVAGNSLGKQISISGLPPPERLTLSPFQELAIGTAMVDGRPYETRPFRCQARAPAAGTLVLAPALQGTIDQVVRNYFFVQRNQQPVHIPVEPLNLALLAPPETGRPRDFSGAVGRFVFRADAAPVDVAVGDLVTVTLRVQGEGLPDSFTPPSVPESPGFKNYGVEQVPGESSDSQRVFRQTVVPLDADARAIPAVSFTFFDARARGYRTQTAGPFPLTFHAERAPVQSIYKPSSTGGVPTTVASPAPVPAPPPSGWFARMKNHLVSRNTSVMTGTGEVTVRLAPSESARPLFTLKPGARVTREAESGGWVRLSCGEGIGWVPEANVAPSGQ
jgi:hypothetical protein